MHTKMSSFLSLIVPFIKLDLSGKAADTQNEPVQAERGLKWVFQAASEQMVVN